MFAVDDGDIEGSGDACKCTGSGVGDDVENEIEFALIQDAFVLENEGAIVAFECAGEIFNGNVSLRALDTGFGNEHLTFADAFNVSVDVFFECAAAECRRGGFVVEGKGSDDFIEGAGGVIEHGRIFVCGFMRGGFG